MTIRLVLRSVGVLIIMALALVLARSRGWISLPPLRAGHVAVMERITIAVHSPESVALLYLAKSRGMLDARGIDATLLNCASETEALNAMIEGAAQLCTLSDFSFASAALRRGDLMVLAALARADTCQLIGRRDRGIVTTSDLKGRRIGVTRGGIGEFLLSRFLAFHDLRLNDVQLQDVRAADMLAAIEGGKIDAAFTWEPHIFEIRSRLGLKSVSWPNTVAEDTHVLLVGRNPWILDHRRLLESVLRALVQAEQFVEADPPAARTALAAQLGFGREYVDAVWRRHQYEVTLPQALLLALEDEARWGMRQSTPPAGSLPNFLRMMDHEPLEQVHPDRITIIR